MNHIPLRFIFLVVSLRKWSGAISKETGFHKKMIAVQVSVDRRAVAGVPVRLVSVRLMKCKPPYGVHIVNCYNFELI